MRHLGLICAIMMTPLAQPETTPAARQLTLDGRINAVSQSIAQQAEEKACKKCGQFKPLTRFMLYKTAHGKARGHTCRDCYTDIEKQRAYDRERYQRPERAEQVKARVKKWAEEHSEYVCERNRKRYQSNRDAILAATREHRAQNREALNERARQRRAENKEKFSEQRKTWAAANPERLREAKRRHYEKHKQAILAKQNERRQRDPERTKEERRLERERNKDYYLEYDRRRYAEQKDKRLEVIKATHKRHPEIKRLVEARRRAKMKGGDGKLTAAEWRGLCARYGHICLACQNPFPFNLLTVDHVIPLSKGGTHTLDNVQPLCIDCNRRKHARTVDYRG